MLRPHLRRLLRPEPPQIRRQHPWPHTPDFHPVRLQLVVPIHHHHVQRAFRAPVADGFEIQLFGPASGEGWGGEVGFSGLGDVGEAGDEDEARVRGFEEEGHESVGEDVGAGDVDVVGVHEAFAEGDVAAHVLDVESGAGVVDKDVEVARVIADAVEGLGDGVVAGEVDLEGGDGVGCAGEFFVEGGDGLVGFLERPGADEDVVGSAGFEEGFDCFVADAAVGACDEDDFR